MIRVCQECSHEIINNHLGVHVRRTDFQAFEKKHFGRKPLDAEYYNYAMEYFQEEYDNCLFIVASDDIKWAKKKLDRKNNKIYFSDQKPTFHPLPGSTSEVVDDDLSKAVHDFILLSRCNHTIISRGKYSFKIFKKHPRIFKYISNINSPCHVMK